MAANHPSGINAKQESMMADASSRSPELLDRQRSRLAVIDMQTKLLAAMPESTAVIKRCSQLIRVAQLLGIPVSATEQYPQGLGPTVPELRDLLGEVPAKLRFSSAESWDWAAGPDTSAPDQIVLAGIECHVCIQQTALDLLARGFRVYVPVDAVTSRKELDRTIALQRLAQQGCTITTTESVLFEWCETAADPQFKQVSQLVK